MIRIALVCSIGTTSGLLKQAISAAALQQNIPCQIDCNSMEKCSSLRGEYDVILLAPQVRFNLLKIQQILAPTPVSVIDTEQFSKCDGKAVLKQALQLIENKEKIYAV